MVLGTATATVYGIFTISRLWLLGFAKATASILSLTLMAFPTIWCCYGVSSRSRAFGYLVLLRVRAYSYSHAYDSLVLLGVYSRSHTRGFTNKVVPPRCLFSISRLWCPTQLGFNVIPIGLYLYQQFGPSTVSSIPSPIQLTFGAAAVLSILSPIRLYHECGAATMSSPLSHSHLFFPTPSCGATNTPPLYSQSRSLWARTLNILMDSQERSLAN
mmetsp:Transcript_21356/g.33036  ORF Transcript_21356/g.33036 Transcript_21356/m.33036 type:complete len:215 (-) Transcript_21356:2436-3080(-)